MKINSRILPGRELRVPYYPFMLLLSLAWPLYYTAEPLHLGCLSYVLQQTAVFSMLQTIDSISANRRLKYTAAGTALIYVFLIHFNALLLSITSMDLYESVTVLATGGDFIYTLEEAGFSTGLIIILAILLAAIFTTGCLIYRFMPHIIIRAKGIIILPLFLFILSAVLFASEQCVNRETPGFFWRRIYPLYLELYSTASGTLTFPLRAEDRIIPESYTGISKAANPRNVVVIILESFRADSINGELAPDMAMLAENSFASANYQTGAIYTSLAWNSILMDRPAYTFSGDIDYDREHGPGSGILRILKKAGYETYIAFSANMEWKGFHERVNGRDRLIDHYYCGYLNRTEERNHIDNRTTARAEEWIDSASRTKPFAMIIHLDSTHWTYYCDPEHRKSQPYAGKDVNIAKLRNPGDIELLYNRYRNSVRQVNSGISRVISALKKNGAYDDTAIVIVSDHGEGFAPGMIGHSVLHDDIKRPAFIMRLPGTKKYSSEEYITDAEIFPTVFDYLGIKGWNGLVRGGSLLDPGYKRECVLSFHGSLLMADITFRDYRVLLRVKTGSSSISFTPVYCTDRSGKIIADPWSGQWKEGLRRIMER
ncbi:MAG TPA: sulfatase-like hydrolase/transferase [Spirochaetota bacterium]|nr:sulfatase-like hydrolase/transferase [Spirochaetota bacterium]